MEVLANLQNDVISTITKSQINFRKSPKEKLTQAYVETRMEILDDMWRAFVDTHRTIVTDVDEAEYKCSKYFMDSVFDTTQELFVDYKTELKECLARTLSAPASYTKAPVSQPLATHVAQVKLPKISIPSFSGEYTEWTTFKALFESLIHRNNHLEKVHKLHYLKAHLSGEAEQLLRHVPISEENYDEAWALLNRRYNNQKYLSNCLFKRLIGQGSITGGSSKALKDLLDTTSDCLNGLRNLGLPTESWDAIVIFIISSKLDIESRKLWEAEISSLDDSPTLSQFKIFLEHRFRSLEFLSSKTSKPAHFSNNNVVVHHAITISCPFCSQSHKLCHCKSFANENIDSRRNFVQSNSLCYNCMSPGHSVFSCRQSSRCRICKKKHHSLLHSTTPKSTRIHVDKSRIVVPASSSVCDDSNVVASHSRNQSEVLLATAVVQIESSSGNHSTFRSLLDQGSQSTFITESAAKRLGLQRVANKVVIARVGDQSNPIVSKSTVNFRLRSIHDPNFDIPVKAHVLSKLTSVIPSKKVKIQTCRNLLNLKLADPNFYTPNNVDLLLGADVISQILVEGLLKGSSGSPTAQNTRLGWVLSGQVLSERVGIAQ